jgi:FtsP/CotA-like multicopper oxidase with cupredoxin domain
MQTSSMKKDRSGKEKETSNSRKMSGSKGDSSPAEVIAQKWDDQKQRLVKTVLRAPEAEIDVRYDALLANRRTLDDPEIISVGAGESVLLRLIAASSNQNFYVDTGALEAEILAVDGKAVRPIKGSFFQLGVAQRIDLKVTIPKEGGAYPILAQGEGTKLLCGVVLLTKGASVPRLSRNTSVSTAALDNTQEKRLQAMNPLPDRTIDRTLPATLGGNMATYVWTINGAAYPIATPSISGAVNVSESPSPSRPAWATRCICTGMTSKSWKSTAKKYPAPCAIRSWFHQVRK